jgi:hypothetical protein
MLATILLAFPVRFSQPWLAWSVPWLVLTAAGPPLLYAVAQTANTRGLRRLWLLPFLVVMGVGLSLNNTAAVLRGLFRIRRDFERTPKFDLRVSTDNWVGSSYALVGGWLVWGELGLAALVLAMLSVTGVRATFAPWWMLYAAGFSYVAGMNLYQTYLRRRWLAMQPRSASGTGADTRPI